MSKLLAGVDIGQHLLTHLGGEAMLLRQFTEGGPVADINAGLVRVEKEYDFQGYTNAVNLSRVDKSLIRKNMTVFGIYGDSLVDEDFATVAPQVNDEIVYGCDTYVIYHVDGDSVGAVWVAYTCAKVG